METNASTGNFLTLHCKSWTFFFFWLGVIPWSGIGYYLGRGGSRVLTPRMRRCWFQRGSGRCIWNLSWSLNSPMLSYKCQNSLLYLHKDPSEQRPISGVWNLFQLADHFDSSPNLTQWGILGGWMDGATLLAVTWCHNDNEQSKLSSPFVVWLGQSE